MSYREVSAESDTFYVDRFNQGQAEEIQQVIASAGGSVAFVPDALHLGEKRARYLVTLPPGCEYTGLDEYMAPQSIILPGGRALCVYPQPDSVLLAWLPGDSATSYLWSGATRRKG